MRAKTEKLEISTDNYFKLTPAKRTWGAWLSYPFITAYNAVRNIFATCLGRLLAFVIFNPGKATNHDKDSVHHVNHKKYPDPEHKEDFHVINAVSRPGFILKILQNYSRKIQGSMLELPTWLTQLLKKILRFNIITPEDCDELVQRIIAAVEEGEAGVSDFNVKNIIIKGLEFVDDDLREKTLDEINTVLRKYSKDKSFDIRTNTTGINFYSLETPDYAVLDSVELRAKDETIKPMSERTFVIFCMPRSNGYCAWLKNLRIAADKAETTYIAFNYRGVERSQGVVWTQDDMVEDAKAQAHRLLLMGAKPENIAFEGECVGGAIATLAAASMHAQGHSVKLFNARSFRSTSHLVLYKLLPTDEAPKLHPITIGRYFLGGLFLLIGMPILYLSNWNLNTEKAWQTIPDKDKDFIVVRSAKNNDDTRNKDDDMIEHQHASIYSFVREKLQGHSEKIDKLALDKLHQHRFTVNSTICSNAKTRDGHVCARYQLSQRMLNTDKDEENLNQQQNARDYTASFYKSIWHKRSIVHSLNKPSPLPEELDISQQIKV